LLVLATAAGLTLGLSVAATILAPPSAVIVSPPGPTVGQKFQLSGSVSRLPGRTVVWAASQEPGDNKFYPQPQQCQVVGRDTFDCSTFYVGKPAQAEGVTYTLIIMAAPPPAVDAFHQYAASKAGPDSARIHGMPALPPSATILTEKQVTLR
jgi:hypothetical protein